MRMEIPQRPRIIAENLTVFADSEAATNFIEAMAKDLSLIAQQHGLDTLSYLLDMVVIEAGQQQGDR